MKAKIIILSLLFVSLTALTTNSYAQGGPKNNRQANKEVVKQRKKKRKEAKKADKEAMKAHYDAQGKKTKRRMKRNQKKTIKMKKNKRPPFWKSWFSYEEFELYIIERIT